MRMTFSTRNTEENSFHKCNSYQGGNLVSKHPCQQKENNHIFITFNWLLLIRKLSDYVDNCCSNRNGTSPAVSFRGVNTLGII
uniref:Uncharacterized protein n=1 Tax=Solanum tuberosum TaxID=4113 RepID=M1AEG4_SOLTU